MKLSFIIVFCLTLLLMGQANATTYKMPTRKGDTVVALVPEETLTITVDHDQTLLDVARRFNLGQTEIVTLNPKLDRWLIKTGEVVRLPNRRILPDSPHDGITLNIAEYRMYYYPDSAPGTVRSYAHGVGRQDWQTPLGRTTVAKKVKNPAWHPPESIRREHAANGDFLPEIVPPGIHNPLGAYALYLNLPGDYRIHGTDIDKIFGIGMQITHGCVRTYPEDIEALYHSVEIGTPVYIVKQPIKVGWLDNTLYVEAHPDLEGEEKTQDQRFAIALALIQKANGGETPDFDQVALNKALTDIDGVPVALYEGVAPLYVPPAPVAELAKGSLASNKKGAAKVIKKTSKSKKEQAMTAKTTPKTVKKSTKVAIIANKKGTEKSVKVSNVNKEKAVAKAQSGSKGGYYHGG